MPNGDSNVRVLAWPDEPLRINATDNVLAVKGQIPVCIRMCEPICAQSRYEIGITIFDRPVATITVAGETRIFNCDEKR